MKYRTKRSFAARAGRVLAVVACVWAAAAAAIVIHGMRMPSDPADVAVIFGNALDDTGAPKPVLAARLDVGVRCYRAGSARRFWSAARSTAPG